MNEGSKGRESAHVRLGRAAITIAQARRWMVVIAAVQLLGLLGGCASHGDSRMEAAYGGADGSEIPDAVPRVEPLARTGNPDSYKVRGKRYYTKKSSSGHVERGLASWYGKQFHGRKTSSGEPYNMYAMTAAHKTLPLPSYVRVTNMENGRTAVVKVNDRGPFHGHRVIDLSYSAAKKLGVIQKGTAMVEVRAIDPLRPAGDTTPFLVAAKGVQKGRRSQPSARVHSSHEPAAVSRPLPAAVASRPVDTGVKEIRERAVDSALAAVEATPVAVKPVAQVAAKAAPSEASDSRQGLYLQVGAFGDRNNAERLRKRLVANLSKRVRIQSAASGEPALYKVRIGPLDSEGEAKAISAKLVTLGVEQPRRIWN